MICKIKIQRQIEMYQNGYVQELFSNLHNRLLDGLLNLFSSYMCSSCQKFTKWYCVKYNILTIEVLIKIK